MSNMSYCRNENTFSDLRDVVQNCDKPTNESEKKYLKKILDECDTLLYVFGVRIDEDELREAFKRVKNLRTIEEIENGE